ncbi:hypothetical protein ACOPJQ_02280 [Luteimonas dalianensis]|uniref:hypothetical protein n=1 Tax=Luteimonas dalianensis TaxID=1148196 RepID=UPI003BF30C82
MLIKLVRWVAALALGLIAYGALRAGDVVPFLLILAGALVVLPPVGALLGRLAAPVGRHGVAIAVGFAFVMAGLAVTGLTSGGARESAARTSASNGPVSADAEAPGSGQTAD